MGTFLSKVSGVSVMVNSESLDAEVAEELKTKKTDISTLVHF